MKTLKAISAGSVLVLGIALSASAFATSITPTGPFSATGSTTLTQGPISLSCTANFTGTVNANGTATVTAASFSGATSCGVIKATGFPWTISATSVSSVNVAGITVSTPFGNCGPSTIGASWSNTTSELSFNNAGLSGSCTVSGTLTTTPPLVLQ